MYNLNDMLLFYAMNAYKVLGESFFDVQSVPKNRVCWLTNQKFHLMSLLQCQQMLASRCD